MNTRVSKKSEQIYSETIPCGGSLMNESIHFPETLEGEGWEPERSPLPLSENTVSYIK